MMPGALEAPEVLRVLDSDEDGAARPDTGGVVVALVVERVRALSERVGQRGVGDAAQVLAVVLDVVDGVGPWNIISVFVCIRKSGRFGGIAEKDLKVHLVAYRVSYEGQ